MVSQFWWGSEAETHFANTHMQYICHNGYWLSMLPQNTPYKHISSRIPVYVLLIYRISKGQEINSGIQSTLGKSVDYCCEKNVKQGDSIQTFQYTKFPFYTVFYWSGIRQPVTSKIMCWGSQYYSRKHPNLMHLSWFFH